MGKSQNSWCDVTKILAFCCVWTQKWPGVTRWAYSKSSSWTVAEPRSLGVGEDVDQGKWLLLPLVTAATSHSEHRPATGVVTSRFVLHPNQKDKCITSLADVLGLQGYFLRAQRKGRRVSFLQQHQKRRAAGWLEEEVRTDCHQNKEPSHGNAKWKACNTLPSWNINQGGKIQKVTWFQIYSVPGQAPGFACLFVCFKLFSLTLCSANVLPSKSLCTSSVLPAGLTLFKIGWSREQTRCLWSFPASGQDGGRVKMSSCCVDLMQLKTLPQSSVD